MSANTKDKINKVLVVDDEPAVCSMLAKFLAKKGYKVSAALSGEEAMKKVKKENPHVVLLDIRMPGIDGIEVLQRIRKFYKNIIIVMITAVKDEEVGKRCMELGADDYITKPLSLSYIEDVLTVKLLNIGR